VAPEIKEKKHLQAVATRKESQRRLTRKGERGSLGQGEPGKGLLGEEERAGIEGKRSRMRGELVEGDIGQVATGQSAVDISRKSKTQRAGVAKKKKNGSVGRMVGRNEKPKRLWQKTRREPIKEIRGRRKAGGEVGVLIPKLLRRNQRRRVVGKWMGRWVSEEREFRKENDIDGNRRAGKTSLLLMGRRGIQDATSFKRSSLCQRQQSKRVKAGKRRTPAWGECRTNTIAGKLVRIENGLSPGKGGPRNHARRKEGRSTTNKGEVRLKRENASKSGENG